MDDNRVNVIIEYPDEINRKTKFFVTLKSNDTIETNEYSGDLTNALIHAKIEELFGMLNLIDNFGFVELDDPTEGMV